jgi:hypothetical protein
VIYDHLAFGRRWSAREFRGRYSNRFGKRAVGVPVWSSAAGLLERTDSCSLRLILAGLWLLLRQLRVLHCLRQHLA